jgi:hypothetical protein
VEQLSSKKLGNNRSRNKVKYPRPDVEQNRIAKAIHIQADGDVRFKIGHSRAFSGTILTLILATDPMLIVSVQKKK